ncbi:hypothetical protein [Ensifer sp. LBL]|uniref:hypothetical protein n=1 Tax=Ensifer sp. LBL TaxID=2991056 RepID=UPI003D1A313F
MITLGDVDYSFRLSSDLQIKRPQILLDHARSLGHGVLVAYLNDGFAKRMSFGGFSISGGNASLGSIKVKDGNIQISSKVLVVLLATYGGIATYSEFRSSAQLLANDINSVFTYVMESSFIEGIKFHPRPEGQIFHDVLAVLPPEQRIKLKESRKKGP